jgi:hypothetical protein
MLSIVAPLKHQRGEQCVPECVQTKVACPGDSFCLQTLWMNSNRNMNDSTAGMLNDDKYEQPAKD